MPKENKQPVSKCVLWNYEESWTQDGYSKLRAFLGNVRVGNSQVYDTPFAKGESTTDLLDAWEKELSRIADKWPSLMEFENDLRAKVGPLSIMKPLDERMDDIESYYADILLPAKEIRRDALQAVRKEFLPMSGLRLRSAADTIKHMKLSTSSGNPFWIKRRSVVDDLKLSTNVTTSFISEGRGNKEILQDIEINTKDRYEVNGIYSMTAVVGWRGQEGGPTFDDVKQRVVWMFPFTINVNELQLYQPAIEACQALNLIPPYVSMEAVDAEITALFDTKAKDDLIVCTDFSKFDQHFNQRLQDAAKWILTALMTPNADTTRWLNRTFPVKYCIPLTIDFQGDDTLVLMGDHGMASGSGGTNFDETLAHRALQHEVAMMNGERLNPHSMCLGDDGILSYPGISVEQIVEAYESHGQVCNTDKQYASSQDCVFLRRWHHTNYRVGGKCVGVYSSFRALGRMRYLERRMDPTIWTPEMVNLRYLSILENCKYHPLFHELIEFCMKRDKYRLGIDLPGFFDNIVKLAQEATDYMPDFLGYTKTLQGWTPSGIKDWEVVKYLSSKR